jgi:hypothetical protein
MTMHINFQFPKKTKEYQPRINPLDSLSDNELFDRYRFNREGLQFIFDTFCDDIRGMPQGGSIAPEIKILVALQYFASNTFQIHIADAFGISEKSACNCVKEVAIAISARLSF